ncbi:helix-turn-helix domain-containing protein [Actinacidiphila oryziradicis]|uniref:Helix-turn-helix domain-containing protein n=1 Tax=Actinacidiphila oryziradicis TaxID=2571141 RepID=A0A4U0SE65_9ACTN|nr:helix-turn-helix transcriptional regulator [Actinacidiphila oryziradicis]TKA06467.1 helix-turn-helix domain-containing protein [Actinacidiphila oryziradicis]
MSNRQPRKRNNDDDRPGIWKGYGKLVKLFRERAGMTQQVLADVVGYSIEQVSSIEQGRRPAKSAFTAAAEEVLQAGGVLVALQEEVDLAKLPAFFLDFALIEMGAVSRFEYEPVLIPGLLQTEEYAQAVFTGHCPPLEEEIIEQYVEARMERQKLLTRSPVVALSFIIGEQALRNPVGGPEVLAAQLHRLLKLTELRNVEIQVMPASTGFHPGLNGPMVLLETDEHRQVGYIESQGVGVVVTDAHKVSVCGLRYGKLRSQALNVEESVRLIERVAGEL